MKLLNIQALSLNRDKRTHFCLHVSNILSSTNYRMSRTRYSNGSEFNKSLAARNGSLTQRVKYLFSKRTVCVSTLMYGCTGLVQVNAIYLLASIFFILLFKFSPLRMIFFFLFFPCLHSTSITHFLSCYYLVPSLIYLFPPFSTVLSCHFLSIFPLHSPMSSLAISCLSVPSILQCPLLPFLVFLSLPFSSS